MHLFFWLNQHKKSYGGFNMMRFFLKTRRKKCRGLAILLSDFGYLGHVTWEIIAFWTSHLIPNLRWPYLDICSFFEENGCFQTIIFLSITSSVHVYNQSSTSIICGAHIMEWVIAFPITSFVLSITANSVTLLWAIRALASCDVDIDLSRHVY